MKLGLVTYNLAAKWDLETLLSNCIESGVEGVELRTTHGHGVEPSLSKDERAQVRQRFADAGITLWGLGSVAEFHSTDPGEVVKHIRDCQTFTRLAADVGAKGVKVRPNNLPEGVPKEKTLAQIGSALAACGEFAADLGVEIWLEVHGNQTCYPTNIHAIMQACNHPSVGVTWNSNMQDRDDKGSVTPGFNLLKPWIKSVHITDLENEYPWKELFGLLKGSNYDRFTLCEYPKSMEPKEGVEFLKKYRSRWESLLN